MSNPGPASTQTPVYLLNGSAADGVLLDIQTIGSGSTNVISGTKAEIDALSTVLKATQVAYEVSVADLEANPSFYATRAANQHITVIDTVANLTGGNALLAAAEHIVVTDVATVAQATTIYGWKAAASYTISDTAANVAGSTTLILHEASTVTVTGTATALQAAEDAISEKGADTVEHEQRPV